MVTSGTLTNGPDSEVPLYQLQLAVASSGQTRAFKVSPTLAVPSMDTPVMGQDWAARYGGKEFLVVLYDVDEKQAYRIRKRIHDKLSDYVLPGKPKSIEVSFDIGFTMLEDRITSADEFIFAARENISENGRFPEKLNAHVSTELLPGSLLTRREMEVAVLLLEGKSNNEIAHSYLSGFLQ